MGNNFELSQLLLYCDGDGAFNLYVEEDTGRGVKGQATGTGTIKNTFYIYKKQKIYKGMQYNKLLSDYDAANRETNLSSHDRNLRFKFSRFVRLYLTVEGTGCIADVILNITDYGNTK